MPIYSRKTLRRDLGRRYTADMPVLRVNSEGTTLPQGIAGALLFYANGAEENLAYSGQNLYQSAWLYVEGSSAVADTALTFYQYMIATFNAGSGAFLTYQQNANPVATISMFEIHTR